MGNNDGYSVIEGAILQSSAEEYKLTLLLDKKEVVGRELVTYGDGLYVRTWDEDIPIYAFKMNKNLQRMLKDGYDIWNS
jgi:hypothetical protein